MKASFYSALLVTLFATCPGPVVAEDIDLFVQPTGAAGVPNILILLDNTANWSKNVQGQAIFINEIKALKAQLASLPANPDGTAKFRVGLMMFTETGGGSKAPGGHKGDDGGYVRAAIRDMNASNRGIYVNLLQSLDETADKSNGGKAGKAFWEAYQYFAGLVPNSGNQKAKTDYSGNTWGTAASRAVYALPGNAIFSGGWAGSPYVSPIANGSCGNNYIIYISNGKAQDNASDTSAATSALASAATADGIANATSPISLTPSGSADNVADEWARFMVNSSKKITTYTLDVDSGTSPSEQGWTRLLKSVAGDDPSRYYAVTAGDNGASISDALGDIFTKIQSVNSVFASVSLPVSVSTQGTYLNQVFIGMFRPNQDALPRWVGNLKQYKLAFTDGNRTLLKTVDSRDNPYTINSGTGFIDKCAQTYWTPAWNGTRDTVWSYVFPNAASVVTAERAGALFCASMPISPWGVGDVTAIDKLGSAQSNTPDGNFVEKGAQGYVLRSSSPTSRTVRTCTGNCSAGLVDFDSTNVSQTDLGATTATEQADLISWAKGLDVADEDGDSVTNEMRPSVHGDVVHSRPVAINFGTEPVYPFDPANDGPRVVVFYAGNDGFLRAINGNRGAVGTTYGRVAGVDPGGEFWSFVPPEFHSKIKPLKVNDTEVAYKDTTATVTQPKPYGMDGAITSYRSGFGVGDPAWIFAAMRRGGRAVYAFDVTDIAADSRRAPTLKWKAGCTGGTCTSGLTDIGQTWSTPRVIKAGYNSGATPLLIMGGGYDACQDADPNTCSSSSTGDHIYILDASNGAHLRTLDTDSQVVGDVVMSSDPSTGYVRWGYAADMAGNVYRISGANANTAIGNTDPASWTITKIASLGCSAPGTCTTPRKFMFAPSVVYDNGTYWIMLGSGDREKPLRTWTSAYGTTNYFFAFKDVPDQASWLTSESTNCSSAVLCLGSLVSVPLNSGDPSDTDLAAKKGWYLGLNPYEQVVTSAVTVFQVSTFSTHTPVPAGGPVCGSSLGTARVYNLDYTNARAKPGKQNRSEVIAGGGLPPSPVAGMVRLDEGGEPVPFLIGGDKDSPLQGLQPVGVGTHAQPKAVTYWYIHK